MDTTKFQAARLIPVTGINGVLEQERRTTSAFLAVVQAVPEYAHTILTSLGAPKGKVTTFIEPEFELEGKKLRPDGLILVEKGTKSWAALVEVKTGTSELKLEQINAYLDIARLNNIPALITISNQVLTLTGAHPTSGIDGRKLKRTILSHYSWIRLLTEAVVQEKFRGVSDPDQAWILRELIRYLQDDASGALAFSDMGMSWVGVRKAAADGTLSAKTAGVQEAVANFESLLRYGAFRLSAKLGVQASEVAPKVAKLDPKKHAAQEVQKFATTSILEGEISVPKTVSNIHVLADLKAGTIRSYVDVVAPREGRESTKVSWLLRQLAASPGDELLIETFVKRSPIAACSASLTMTGVEAAKLVPADGREISFFRLSVRNKMGTKRNGEDSSGFVGSVVQNIENCYRLTLERLKAWAPKAPKLSVSEASISPFEPAGADAPLPSLGEQRLEEVLLESQNDKPSA